MATDRIITIAVQASTAPPRWQRGARGSGLLGLLTVLQSEGAGLDEGKCKVEESVDRHRAEVTSGAKADGYRVGGRLTLADDEHIRNLLKLRVADLGLHAIALVVERDAEAASAELPLDLASEGDLVVRNRDEGDLNGSQPEREGAGIVLDEPPTKRSMEPRSVRWIIATRCRSPSSAM